MNIINRLKIFIAIVCVAVFVGCPSNPNADKSDPAAKNSENGTVSGNRAIDSSKITSLQMLINDSSIKDGAVISLSDYPNIGDYNATINKAVTINSSDKIDLSKSALTVSKDNVTLNGLANANVTTASKLGAGSLKISGSSLNSLVLNGGGANSIHLNGVNVKHAVANYKDVRLHFSGESKVKRLDAVMNCKIEDDNVSDSADVSSDTVVEQLSVGENAVAEVKTVVGKLDVSGDNAEVLLSRANSYISSFDESVNADRLGTFRLTSIEKVKISDILASIPGVIPQDIKKKIQYKTSECIVLGEETKSAYNKASYNFDGFVKAWKHYSDNSSDPEENRIWSNYQNVRVLDKYRGKPITKLADKAFQMCQWLTAIDIGDSVAEIGNLAFLGCSNLKALYMRPKTPPAVIGSKLFFTKTDALTDETKLDRTLFDPTSDFISAECIDYFIEWYKGSDYAREDGLKIISDIDTVIGVGTPVFGNEITSIGMFLKSPRLRGWSDQHFDYIRQDCKLGDDVPLKPAEIIETIMSEWDKTICRTDMSNVTIYVPAGSADAYKAAPVWGLYADRIVEVTGEFYESIHAED